MPPSYLDIGMGGHFERRGSCEVASDLPRRQKQFFSVLTTICVVLTHDI